MTDDLLPCPFCGAEQDDHGDLNDDAFFCKSSSGMLAIGCSNCMCVGAEGSTRAEAIAAWNRRAIPATDAREKALHPDDMLPEAIRLIRQEATRDHSQDVVTGLKHIALLLEQLIGEARDEHP